MFRKQHPPSASDPTFGMRENRIVEKGKTKPKRATGQLHAGTYDRMRATQPAVIALMLL